MAKKTQKKKSMKLRRQIRKTLGSIFLITALLVAAVPVPEASADTEKTKYTWDDQIGKSKTTIPTVPKNCDTIYTTGDGVYQFAYVSASATSPDKIAVILGYNANTLENNYLEIPDTVDAYTKFSENEGSRTGYVAVSKNQKPLFYESSPAIYEDVSGNNTPTLISPAVYSPCYAADKDKWGELPLDQFYYKDASGNYVKTEIEADQWIKNLDVMYIGNQSLTVNPAAANADGAVQEWIIAEASGELNTIPENGVFANESNIKTLVVGDSLMGIGNYAFYGCTNLESIQLGNGLTEMGKYAFANCVNMTGIGIDFASRLQYISDYTFLNCRALKNFTLPSSVTMIYDHAFEGCSSLGNESLGGYLDIAGVQEDKNMTLAKLGYYVFKNCTGLTTLVLPDSIVDATAPVHLNNFQGCTNLRTVKVESSYTIFEADADWKDGYHVEEFYNIGKDEEFLTCKDDLGIRCEQDAHSTFYFEGIENSAIHTYTKENAIPFKYAGKDCYELVKVEKDASNNRVELTYQVNSSNQLINFKMDGKPEEVTIPTTIGPYGISEINSGSFSGNCFLKKITIPGTVSKINENAFKGCHNLEHVIFDNAAAITFIGSGAFATQVADFHASDCTNKDYATTTSADYVANPKLTFTGEVATGIVPYEYAMNAANYINAGTQNRTYITYYSGWPTNLEIKYVVDEETNEGKATLVDYPTYEELAAGTKYTEDAYPYITTEYEDAAKKAIALYNNGNPDPTITDDQMDIINAALKLYVPTGVKAYADGLFSGVTRVLNEDGTYSIEPVTGQTVDEQIQSVTFADIDEFTPYSFSGCTSLESLTVTGGVAAIDDYAFADMAALKNATLSATTESIGLRPFIDCPLLEDINFSGSPYFTCENAIIYGLVDGTKDSVVQCLETRGKGKYTGTLSPTELAGINSLYPEAFMDCTEIGQIDLSQSNIKKVSEKAFANTTKMYRVIIPTTCKTISKDAFYDSSIQFVEIPSSVNLIDEKAFNTDSYPKSDGTVHTIQFYCEEDSAAMDYADEYENIVVQDIKPSTKKFKVIFWDYDESIIDTQEVSLGEDAVAPPNPVREGYRFTGWLPSYKAISTDSNIVAQYEKIDSSETMLTVTFLDWDDTILKEDKVQPGEDAEAPNNPVREGYTFTGWRPAITNITEDTTVYAQYEKIDSSDLEYVVEFYDWDDKLLYTQKVTAGEDAISPKDPVREGYTFTGWKPDITNVTRDFATYAQYEKNDGTGSDPSPSTSPDPNNPTPSTSPGPGDNGDDDGNGNGNGNGNGTTAKLYTLTVLNGSGSGSYVAGSQPIIIADDPASGMAFDKWTISPEDTDIKSRVLTATVITMPEENVTVTAHYKKATGNTVVSGSGNSSTNGTRPGTNSGTITNGGTTVIIDKNGLSNTGVVSATVNGSSDDFVIKITESAEATEQAIKALMAEYGDITNIKYFPMDISLYDSTGKNKITDTTGLSISITLPLPDSLITYAGNNKIASVVDGKLDKLGAKFTTISGVSCITFTAEHFSPYVIYVDTGNLTAGTISDDTPKTGDGVHPKWFLSIGLACLSMVLFMKKDKKVAQKVKVRA